MEKEKGNLAPSMTVPGRESMAPARWTTAEPAKSVNPLGRRGGDGRKPMMAAYSFVHSGLEESISSERGCLCDNLQLS